MTKLAGLTAFALLVASTAMAQDVEADIAVDAETAVTETTTDVVANNSSFGDWLVTCQAITTRDTACRLMQEQSLRETNQLIARFIALPAEEGGAILLAQVPMGAYLPGGAVYRIGGREDLEQRSMVWQRCLGELCEAAIQVDKEEIALMQEEGAILFGYRMDVSAEPIVLRVETASFADGVEAIDPTIGQ